MANPRKRLLLLVIAIVLAAAVAAIVLYVRARREPRELVLSGTLEARTVQVGSLVGGRVSRVFIDEGSHVTAGQVLVQLEPDTLDRQIAQQQAAIDAARAAYQKALNGPLQQDISKAAATAANAESERRRYAAMYRDGIVSKEQYDAAATTAKTTAEDLSTLKMGTRKEDIEAARAEVEQQQRQLAVLMKQHSELQVKSSVTGTVQSFGLRPGDIVSPNQEVAEIIESSQLWVRVYVPETQLGLLRVNQPVRVSVDTYPNQWFPGHIATIAAQGEYTPQNVQTRAQRAEEVFAVKVLVDPNPKLHAGMATQVDTGVKVKGSVAE